MDDMLSTDRKNYDQYTSNLSDPERQKQLLQQDEEEDFLDESRVTFIRRNSKSSKVVHFSERKRQRKRLSTSSKASCLHLTLGNNKLSERDIPNIAKGFQTIN